MKTSEWVLVGALAVGAYVLLSAKKDADSASGAVQNTANTVTDVIKKVQDVPSQIQSTVYSAFDRIRSAGTVAVQDPIRQAYVFTGSNTLTAYAQSLGAIGALNQEELAIALKAASLGMTPNRYLESLKTPLASASTPTLNYTPPTFASPTGVAGGSYANVSGTAVVEVSPSGTPIYGVSSSTPQVKGISGSSSWYR